MDTKQYQLFYCHCGSYTTCPQPCDSWDKGIRLAYVHAFASELKETIGPDACISGQRHFVQYLTIQHWHEEWLDPQNVVAPRSLS